MWELVILSVIGVLIIGAFWQRAYEVQVSKRYSPSGKILLINGRQVHVHDSGLGSPVVVFESGASGCYQEWTKVVPAISEITRTIHIERPGNGFSEPCSQRLTAESTARETLEILDFLGVDGGIVFVGNSLGGIHIREMARQRPTQTSGMIYVDPTHEVAIDAINLRLTTSTIGGILYIISLLGEFGALRILEALRFTYADFILKTSSTRGSNAELDFDLQRAIYGRRSALWTAAKEMMAVSRITAEVADSHLVDSLPNVPTVVLSADAFPKSLTSGMRRCVEEGHSDLAGYYTDGRHEIVEGSGHLIQIDRPDRVILAIREVLEKARTV